MEIYLIRHTTPAVERGICYGFSDIDVADTFETEAARIVPLLPEQPFDVYTSPLQRCHKLATRLFGEQVSIDRRLMELNFGDWEMQRWEALGPDALQKWMDDFVYERVPNGESYEDLYLRSLDILQEIIAKGRDAVLVTHSGVIRALLAHVTHTPLEKSFDRRTEYGRVARLSALNGQIEMIFYNA
ncbi:alpha-ribazole phosphatase family protein [Chitinophaga vietnamensis]|uniref:alpha-ribazole phosphatase family protein n=1 Tax=Chitinophaga vietnamensis TaxID=2593957 RepID=UPI0013760D7B|nr:alpha-ribazole phosphatase family protein [Chitinophaga vietnamensis]